MVLGAAGAAEADPKLPLLKLLLCAPTLLPEAGVLLGGAGILLDGDGMLLDGAGVLPGQVAPEPLLDAGAAEPKVLLLKLVAEPKVLLLKLVVEPKVLLSKLLIGALVLLGGAGELAGQDAAAWPKELLSKDFVESLPNPVPFAAGAAGELEEAPAPMLTILLGMAPQSSATGGREDEIGEELIPEKPPPPPP